MGIGYVGYFVTLWMIRIPLGGIIGTPGRVILENVELATRWSLTSPPTLHELFSAYPDF